MADLWHVFKKDGTDLGLLSASEIRDAMRDGRVDPFDQVCRQGSNVRIELVEVDEIFAEVAPSEGKKRDSIYSLPPEKITPKESEEDTAGRTTVVASNIPENTQVNGAPLTNFNPKAKARAEARARKQEMKAKKKMRRYHLMDKKKRLLGPLSAAEIQSLFYRGVLEKNVKVAKDKDGKRVPITQFVAAYAGENAKKFESENTRIDLDPDENAKLGFPSSKVLEQLTRTSSPVQTSNKVVPVISIALMAVFAVIAYFAVTQMINDSAKKKVLEKGKLAEGAEVAVDLDEMSIKPSVNKRQPIERPMSQPEQRPQTKVAVSESVEIKRAPAASPMPIQPKQTPPKPRVAVQPKVRQPAYVPPPPPKPPAPVIVRQPVTRPQTQTAAQTPPQQPTASNASVSRRRERQQREEADQQREAPERKPQPKLAARQITDVTQPSAGGKDPFEAKVGGVGTFSGMQFDRNELAGCGLKCTLTFRDAEGHRVQGIFFKGQYEEKLNKSGGKATISGRIAKQGAGYVIYLNGVK